MKEARFIVGIDLGTTHCVLAWTEVPRAGGEVREIRIFPVPQLWNPGEMKAQPLLPSFLFLPGPHDVPAGGIRLPWNESSDIVVGELGRSRGAEIPNRLVSSAKSWLCHSGVNRTEAILPWESPPGTRRMSPVEASARLLGHLRDAWNHEMAARDPGDRLEDQEIYLTVPASFDAVARELTVRAARAARLENLTLLEEPQAAFYAWIQWQADGWRKEVRVGESVLVCDVGGGTTDLSLIQVAEEQGELTLRRMAVGEHILLGGDNMDLALAHFLRAKISQKEGSTLDSWQTRGLTQSCRTAKERLLSDAALEREPVAVLGRGTSLIKGTVKTEMSRSELEAVLLDGFFPRCGLDELPARRTRVGIQEIGLPYEAEPGVTRHLAHFLRKHAGGSHGSGQDVAFPSAVLFNGGVMKPQALRQRVLESMAGWAGRPIRELASGDLELAAARGAAYYGLARRGRGIRIRAGTARSYYIGIETAMPAVPGVPAPIKALCVVPFGMEEGTEAEIRGREFGLVVGEPAAFHLLASTVRKKDEVGEIVEDWKGDIDEVTAMETELSPAHEGEGMGLVPVWLLSKVTEVGTLELWCVSSGGERRWKLQFDLRESA
ncbi:MAG: Hsp70 family protein [bacterium]